jgi:hypothetical protein
MIEAQLYAHLSTWPGLAAIIDDRVYPLQLPQGVEMPALTYMRVSTVAVQHRSSQAATFSRARFQLDGWALDFDTNVALRRQIRLAMGAFVVLIAPRVDVALLAGDRDTLEAEPDRWRCTLDYMISHEED